MKTFLFLSVNQNGTGRVTKSRPSLNWSEVSIGLSLEVPDELFDRPILKASITIPREVAMNTLTAEVVDNAQDAIEVATGLKFVVKVETQEENL